MLADSSDRVHNRECQIRVRLFTALNEEVAGAEQVALNLRCDARGKIVLDCSPVVARGFKHPQRLFLRRFTRLKFNAANSGTF
ncbi:hypothetical protein [Caballeronia sp. INSB1]|uniref:hypothetical protein n=1 Tax=Caballeronia sp. INSB1 TaxID=2921751 RepID=UPI00077280BB|nr:hypothetical protein [Caballeronia sp. INSB1]